jgi:hypothetical protein
VARGSVGLCRGRDRALVGRAPCSIPSRRLGRAAPVSREAGLTMPHPHLRPGSWSVPVPIRALGGVLLVGGVVVEALHELTVPPGSSAAGPLFDDWLHDTLILASAGVCAAGARRHTRDARAWACIAAALLCIGLGEVVWGLLYENTNTAIPYPNPADAFDLASYPLFAAGLILIVRRRVPSIELHRWLDGLVIILVVATPMVALVLQPVLRNAPTDRLGQIVTLAYPLGDLMLIGALLGALPMMSWRVDASWILLGAGLLCLTVGDSSYAVAALEATYHDGPYDFLWSAGSVAIAAAAWLPTGATRPPSQVVGWRAIVLPLSAQLFALGTQIYGWFLPLPRTERLLTIAVLGIGAAQIIISRPRAHPEPAADPPVDEPPSALPDKPS